MSIFAEVSAFIEGFEIALTDNGSAYRGSFAMSPNTEARNYEVMLIATDAFGNSINEIVSFEYASMVAIEIDSEELMFTAMPGTMADGESEGAGNITIFNLGNVPLDIELYATNLSGSSGKIGAGSIAFTFDNDYAGSLAGTLSEAPQLRQVGIMAGNSAPLSLRLNVPSSTIPGNYSGEITLLAVKS